MAWYGKYGLRPKATRNDSMRLGEIRRLGTGRSSDFAKTIRMWS